MSSTENSRPLVTRLAPTLVALCGCATLTAAKIIGETAGIERFHSRHAFARHNGTAPVPVWSSNRHRFRLSRTGNRQLNAALHRIAITQAHYHPQARELLQRRRAAGDTKTESIRVLSAGSPTSSTEHCSLTSTAPTRPRRPPSPPLDIGASGHNSARIGRAPTRVLAIWPAMR